MRARLPVKAGALWTPISHWATVHEVTQNAIPRRITELLIPDLSNAITCRLGSSRRQPLKVKTNFMIYQPEHIVGTCLINVHTFISREVSTFLLMLTTNSSMVERFSASDSCSDGRLVRMWVRIPTATVVLVSLSKTLDHNCFSPPRSKWVPVRAELVVVFD